ncbi:hypothetical protein PsAD46_01341 [Pseudovibrio sp. Ad46]|nr:hypothetical protein PsAD46_01341 [Pseudovibrio sp. Ad46]KZK98911.1 hypothetical protein PsAD5_01534 [Pseudovibrio sp. Ad5]
MGHGLCPAAIIRQYGDITGAAICDAISIQIKCCAGLKTIAAFALHRFGQQPAALRVVGHRRCGHTIITNHGADNLILMTIAVHIHRPCMRAFICTHRAHSLAQQRPILSFNAAGCGLAAICGKHPLSVGRSIALTITIEVITARGDQSVIRDLQNRMFQKRTILPLQRGRGGL